MGKLCYIVNCDECLRKFLNSKCENEMIEILLAKLPKKEYEGFSKMVPWPCNDLL